MDFNSCNQCAPRETKSLAHITDGIWDFDGVKYSFDAINTDFQIVKSLYDQCSARAACEMMPNLDHAEALKISAKSYNNYGDSIGGYLAVFELHGLEKQTAVNTFFSRYHEILFDMLDAGHQQAMAQCALTNQLFHQMSADVRHSILSHSSRDTFINPFLIKLDRKEHFPCERIFDYAAINYRNKKLFEDGIRMAVEGQNIAPAKAFFAEDSLDNLVMAKRVYPELTTIWISDKPLQKEYEPFVDLVMKSPLHLMQTLAADKGLTVQYQPEVPAIAAEAHIG